jgi:uncharacterized protein YijF (DUF1287 family)
MRGARERRRVSAGAAGTQSSWNACWRQPRVLPSWTLMMLAVGCAPVGADRGDLRAQADSPAPRATAPITPITPITRGSEPVLPPARAIGAEASLGVQDRGIFSDLDERVRLSLPAQLEPAQLVAAVDVARRQLVLFHAGRPLKVYPLAGEARLRLGAFELALRAGDRAELEPLLSPERVVSYDERAEWLPADRDDDGIPDPLDVLIGAHKTALNADRYDGRYVQIAYPGGDVPREIGVCSDVVIRALRNAGIDLQRELQEDRARAPGAYPQIRAPNPSIDHRRVKNLLPLFARRFEARSSALSDPADPLLPGDIVFMDTFPERPGTEHVGIVSDSAGPSGLPLIINNWTDGTVTKPMDLLSFVPVTHRFRVSGPRQERAPISALRTQLIRVVSNGWADMHAELRRYAREPGGAWREVGRGLPVVLGRSGYGWGDGLHGSGAPAARRGGAAPIKREGDGRSPAGVFEVGPAHGYVGAREAALAIPYTQADESQRCVDDPRSRHYNRVLSQREVEVDWSSAEHMRRPDDLYELAIEVGHNRAPVTAGHGSCIFLHVWASPDTPVTGCTALDKTALYTLARWLRPNAVLVALPRSEYAALARAWGLP